MTLILLYVFVKLANIFTLKNCKLLNQKNKISLLCKLGHFLQFFCSNNPEIKKNKFTHLLLKAVEDSISINPYFNKENIIYNIKYWSKILNKKDLNYLVQDYTLPNKKINVGIIMAGNIPLVGFHDFICVFLSGHKSIVKLSNKDNKLFIIFHDFLINTNKEVKKYIKISENIYRKFDAVIATGNNLSSNLFKNYYEKIPKIIRSARYSVAVLNGNESDDDLKKLSFDIFMYYGMGCRNVSKLFLPINYNFEKLIKNLREWKQIISNDSYRSNYLYNKAIYSINGDFYFDTGHSLLIQSNKIGSPIGTTFYSFYEDEKDLKKNIVNYADKIQCIVSNNIVENSIDFGSTQCPSIDDYADNINTMDFLLKLS